MNSQQLQTEVCRECDKIISVAPYSPWDGPEPDREFSYTKVRLTMTPEQLKAAGQQAMELLDEENRLRDEFHRTATKRRDLEHTISAERLKAAGVQLCRKFSYRGSYEVYHLQAPNSVEVEWELLMSGEWRMLSVDGLKVESKE